MSRTMIALLLWAMMVVARPLQANTIRVPLDQGSISAAMAVAVAGDTVLVAPGTHPCPNVSFRTGVVLRGETGDPQDVVLDGLQTGRHFTMSSTSAATRLEAVTLTGGLGTSIYASGAAGTIADCVFSGNSATGYGGAMYLISSPALVVGGCVFSGNTAANGGAIYSSNGPTDITGCTFVGNVATGSGGAIYRVNTGAGACTGCVFDGNRSANWGGAIYNSGSNPLLLQDCTFLRNDSGGNASCFFASTTHAVEFRNCTLAYNESGPIYANSGTVVLANTLIAFNSGPAAVGTSAFSTSCCDVYGNTGGDYESALAGHEGVNGNLSLDPLFCDQHVADLRLATGSPCLADPLCGLIGAQAEGCATAAGPKSWWVPQDAATIAGALDLAWVGDEIVLSCGTYDESEILLRSAVDIRGETGAADCVTVDAGGGNVVFRADGAADVTISGLTITGAGGYYGAAVYGAPAGPVEIVDSVVTGNTGGSLGVPTVSGVTAVRGCTVAFNRGAGLGSDGSLAVDRCIVAYNRGEALVGAPAAVSCSDFHGNAGGDWQGDLAPFLGQDGNIAADPGFCDYRAGDLTLAADSPAATAPCGPMGALPAACGAATPLRVWHVPADVATIAAALDTVVVGETVELAAGRYFEHDLPVPAGITLRGAPGAATDAVIDADRLGRVLDCRSAWGARIENLTVVGGTSTDGGGAYCQLADGLVFDGCVFLDNAATNGGGLYVAQNCRVSLLGCTLAYNQATGAGGAIANIGDLTVDRSLIAFSLFGEGLYTYTTNATTTITCTDIHGNQGGDWVGGIADRLGVDGNFSSDPLFCDGPHGDVGLAAGSPCLDQAGCGGIGAMGEGCGAPTPPREWLVPSEVPTIQAAIDGAGPFDIVVVAPGLYTWTGEGTSAGDGMIVMRSAVEVRGATGDPADVVLDAEGLGRVVQAVDVSGLTRLANVTLRNGALVQDGAGLHCERSPIVVENCHIEGNATTSSGRGGGAAFLSSAAAVVDCTFEGNNSASGAAVLVEGQYNTTTQGPVFTRCFFLGNQGAYTTYWHWSRGTFEECNLYGNAGSIVIYAWGATVYLDRSIIAGNAASAGQENAGSIVATCSDIFGTAGALASDIGNNGNIATDPIFCDAAAGDFHLSWESLCWSDCGQMGPLGVGTCGFGISSVTDVGPDQGGQLRVRWERAFHDDPATDTAVASYALWRRVDDGAKGMPPEEMAKLLPGHEPPAGEWDCVLTVPAWARDGYSVVSPTICDSTAAGGACWSVFFVTAHGTDPALFWVTEPDSGYSVDNLAPAVPANLSVLGGRLSWAAVPDADLGHYSVFGSGSGFRDGSETVIDHTAETGFDVSGQPFAFYLVTASDFAGNESGAAVVPSGLSAVPATLPELTALRGNRPNPFNPATLIEFDLAADLPVRLHVYDIAGRVVRRLEDGAVLAAGRHGVRWNGRDDAGRTVPAGVYFYRFEAGEHRETRRMVLIK